MDEKKIRPFGIRDKVGYMFGDIANDFTFIFAGTFLMVFYTKVLGISSAVVGTLFLVARFVDAFTDVTMGRIVDRMEPGRDGRFRCWIRRMAGPVAIASFLMYQSGLAGAPMWLKILYMYVTYILWGSVFYTAVNIPYGSMASVITDNPQERTSLSTFRGIGATLAGLLIGTLGPQLIYVTDENGNQLVAGGRVMLIAGIFSLLAILCYIICYCNTVERISFTKGRKEPMSFSQSFGKLLTSKALLAVIGASIFLMLSQLMIQSLNNYLYTDYFKDKNALSMFSLINSLVGILLISPLVGPASRNFGKKESAAVVTLFAAVMYGILFFFPIGNKWVYLFGTILGFTGINFFNMVIWALITDVIDDLEIKNDQRDDGTVYAVYSFARKVGQALAGGAGGWALYLIGYDELAAVQTPQVLNRLYAVVNLVPAIGFLIVSLLLGYVYPLGKRSVEKNAAELKRRREGVTDGIE
jgi:GPH family glycoside/pentoside/hexuronide:cation symporter